MGVSYFDTTFGNLANGSRQEDVDAYDGGVGWIENGEWPQFTVDVETSGLYTITSQVSTVSKGSRFRIEFGNRNVTGSLLVPNTGSWSNFSLSLIHI